MAQMKTIAKLVKSYLLVNYCLVIVFCAKFYQDLCRSIITVAFVASVQVGADVVNDARAPRHCDQNPGGHGQPHLHPRHRHVHLRCNWNAAVLNHIH